MSGGFPSIAGIRKFLDLGETVRLDLVQQWRYENRRVEPSQSHRLFTHKSDSVTNLIARCIVVKVRCSGVRTPAAALGQSPDEDGPLPGDIRHPAIRVREQGHGGHATDGDCIGHLKLAVPQIAAGRLKNIGELIWQQQILPLIHAHADEEAGMARGGRQRRTEGPQGLYAASYSLQ